MSRSVHVFRTPDRFVAGTVGQPGERTFYLQVTKDQKVLSVLLEKQQVRVLADRVEALLTEVARRFAIAVPPTETPVADLEPLRMPVDTEFRVGTMGLGWDSESAAVVIELLAVTEDELDESVVLADDAEDGPDAVRVFLSPIAAREFANRAGKVIEAGRPACPLCGEPLDPDGHMCIRLNGYRRGAVFGSDSAQ